jgi:hypothetical protein
MDGARRHRDDAPLSPLQEPRERRVAARRGGLPSTSLSRSRRPEKCKHPASRTLPPVGYRVPRECSSSIGIPLPMRICAAADGRRRQARQPGGLEVPGSSPGAPTVRNRLQSWLKGLLGRPPSAPNPGQTPGTNDDEQAREGRRECIAAHSQRGLRSSGPAQPARAGASMEDTCGVGAAGIESRAFPLTRR